eukprot:315828_1
MATIFIGLICLCVSHAQTITNIGGIFDPSYPSEYDAFMQAIADINSNTVNNAEIFNGMTFNASYVIQSSSSNIKDTAAMLSTDVSIVIGPRYSKQAERLSPLFTLTKTPYISYRASASVLSDRIIFPYFFRTVPDVLDLAIPIIELFKQYNWEQAVLLHSAGHWGRGLNFLVQMGAENGISFISVEIADGYTVDMIANALQQLDEYELFVLHVPTEQRAAIYEAADNVGLIREGVAWLGTDDITVKVASESAETKTRMESSLAIRPMIQSSAEDWHAHFVYDAVLLAAYALAYTHNQLGLDVTATSALQPDDHFGAIRRYLTNGEALSNSLNHMQLASDWTSTGSIYLRDNTRRMPYELVNLQDGIWQVVAEFNWNSDNIKEAIADDSYCNDLSQSAQSAALDEYNDLTSAFSLSDCSLFGNFTASNVCDEAIITFYEECLSHYMGFDTAQWTYSPSHAIEWSLVHDTVPIGAHFSRSNPLRVLVSIIEPWGTADGLGGYDGFLPTLWAYLITAHDLNCEYTDGSQYTPQEALDLVQNGSYDVALGAFTITSDRSSRVRFLHQFYGGGQRILTFDPTVENANAWFFLAPLSYRMWQVWGCAIVIVAHLLWIMEWDTPTFKELDENTGRMKRMSYQDAILDALTISTSVLFFTHEAPRGKHSRWFIAVWEYIVLILVSAYTANMVSFITNSSAVEGVIDDEASLYLESASVITVPNTASADILEAGNITYTPCDTPYDCLQMMYATLNHSDAYYNAFVYDDLNVEYWARTSDGCRLITSGSPFNSFSAAIATRYEFIPQHILESMDLLTIKLWSNGTITQWMEEFISADYPCEAFEGAADETTPLDVFSFYPLWVLIGGGSLLFCTIVICTVERSKTPIDKQLQQLNRLVQEGAEEITRVGTLHSKETFKDSIKHAIEMETITDEKEEEEEAKGTAELEQLSTLAMAIDPFEATESVPLKTEITNVIADEPKEAKEEEVQINETKEQDVEEDVNEDEEVMNEVIEDVDEKEEDKALEKHETQQVLMDAWTGSMEDIMAETENNEEQQDIIEDDEDVQKGAKSVSSLGDEDIVSAFE